LRGGGAFRTASAADGGDVSHPGHPIHDPVYVTVSMKGNEYTFRCMGLRFGKNNAWRLDIAVSAEALPFMPRYSKSGDSLAGLQHKIKAALEEKQGRKITGVTQDVLDWPGKDGGW